jgi:hypothetical protein
VAHPARCVHVRVFVELRRNITDEVRSGVQLTYLAVRGDPGDVNLSPEGTDHIPGAGLLFQTDTRNLPVYPTRGWWIGFGGVETDYRQADLDVRLYLEFGGANSIRGWDLGSPVGKNQFINTAEYWHLLLDHKRVDFWFFRMALGSRWASSATPARRGRTASSSTTTGSEGAEPGCGS